MQNGSSLPEIHHPIFTRSEYQKLLKKTTKRCPCVYSDLTGKNRAWIGLVQNEDTATAGDTKSCSASIISPTFLITSASCMCNLMKGFCPLKSTDGPMGNFYSKDPTKLSDKFIVNYDDGAVCPDPKFDIKKKYEKYPDVQSLDKWCYTCSSGLPNNCEDWGYCSRNCEFLSELNTPKYPIVEGIANTVQNKDNCGEKKNICVMDILFEGNSITMKEDDNHKYVEDSSTSFGQMKIFEDIKKNMKSYSNHNCKDLSGGAVWTILSVGRGKNTKHHF
ncbi:uncharacterized protein [Lepeophtheirus salmonis]|uniref:uncharacterized protein n=1 Tax=Lepeophtheirus salmonis TaxID=72036 RepID=UPI003AF36EBC